MATNFVQPADTITFAHSAPVNSGVALNIGQVVGIALGKYGANEAGSYKLTGAFTVPKADATGALLPGAYAYFAGGEVFSSAATGRVKGGVVIESASASAETCVVMLTPGAN
jgi:predicted RecA/RadA family phage recombinase